jgi:riboflavin kinase/FMN adenylyltransferase
MANIGVRPTFTDGERRTIEAHLFDFSDELYNRTVDIECRTLLRFEQKFPSKEAFLEQLARDRAASETALELIRAAGTSQSDRLESSE